MLLERMSVANFLSFGPEQVLDLDRRGLVLVDGDNRDEPLAASNGAGKSALPEAVVWALTGRTMRGLTGDEVINERVGRDCKVELVGRHQGKLWRVERGRKTGPRASSLAFWVDGQEQTLQGEPRETQRRLEHFLGITFETLMATTVFGQGDRWRFSELSDARRKELLDHLLGTRLLGAAQVVIKGWLTGNAEELAASEREYARLKASYDAERRTLTQLRTWGEDELRRRQVALEKEVLEAKHALEKHLARPMPRVNGETVERAEKLVAKREREHAEAQRVYDRAARQCAKAEAIKRRAALDHTTAKGRCAEIEGLAVGAECWVCGTRMVGEARVRCIERANATYDSAAAAYDIASVRLKVAKEEREAASEALETASKARVQAHQRLRRTIERVHVLNEYHGRTAMLSDAEKVACDKLTRLKKAPSPSRKKVKEQVRKLKALKADLLELKRAKEALCTRKQYLDFWVTGFGNAGVKSHLLDHVTPVLNDRAERYATYLTRGLQIEFQAQKQLKGGGYRDWLTLDVRNHYGASTYAGNSGGERRKVDIVVARALQSLEQDNAALRSNVVWWDEVFESLDEASCEAVLQLLQHELKDTPSVFVVSHLQWLKPHFPHVLTVVKEGGYSRLEWQ